MPESPLVLPPEYKDEGMAVPSQISFVALVLPYGTVSYNGLSQLESGIIVRTSLAEASGLKFGDVETSTLILRERTDWLKSWLETFGERYA